MAKNAGINPWDTRSVDRARAAVAETTSKKTKMMRLSARFEIRSYGVKNSARFTREAANRIAQSLRAHGLNVKVIEHA